MCFFTIDSEDDFSDIIFEKVENLLLKSFNIEFVESDELLRSGDLESEFNKIKIENSLVISFNNRKYILSESGIEKVEFSGFDELKSGVYKRFNRIVRKDFLNHILLSYGNDMKNAGLTNKDKLVDFENSLNGKLKELLLEKQGVIIDFLSKEDYPNFYINYLSESDTKDFEELKNEFTGYASVNDYGVTFFEKLPLTLINNLGDVKSKFDNFGDLLKNKKFKKSDIKDMFDYVNVLNISNSDILDLEEFDNKKIKYLDFLERILNFYNQEEKGFFDFSVDNYLLETDKKIGNCIN